MKTSSYSINKVKQSVENFFIRNDIKKLAEKTGFTKQAPKKILCPAGLSFIALVR